jgi:transposase InsO family protein
MKVCHIFGITRQAYYKHNQLQEERSMEESIILQMISKVRKKHRYMGVKKIYFMIQPELLEHSIKIGRDGIYTIMSQNGLIVRKRRRRAITTNSNHDKRIYDNKIMDMEINRPNQLLVGDITYIPFASGFLYLSLITDAYSRKVLGYHLSRTLETTGTKKALMMALLGIESGDGIIHHSDRGIQYSSKEYTDILKEKGICISMSRRAEPTDNPIAERINGIIKHEYLKGQPLESLDKAKEIVCRAINLYNNERPHLSCGMLTPAEEYKGDTVLTNLWKTK